MTGSTTRRGYGWKHHQIRAQVPRQFADAVGNVLKQRLTAGPLAGQFAGPRYRYVP
jgi:hypothetical protein